jgi:mono/diheme cytochrome c family protein
MCRFFPSRRSTCAAILVLLAFSGASVLPTVGGVQARQSNAGPPRTVWDGVYTLAQAKRGALKSGLCTSCHGEGFTGGSAPDLAGEPFMSRWGGKSVGDLFDLIRLTMPDDDPGSLAREEYADLVAYVLAVNKFPTGDVEIGTSIEPLKTIQIVATKP